MDKEVDIDSAIPLIEEKLKADEPIHIYNDLPVRKGKGRFGPFIKWNEMFINVNKTYDFDNLTIDNIEELIEIKLKKEKKEFELKEIDTFEDLSLSENLFSFKVNSIFLKLVLIMSELIAVF